VLPNVNGSLSHKTKQNWTNYFTYNYSRNTAGAEGNGGGYLLTKTRNDGNGNIPIGIDKDSYQTPASLFEVGSKLSLMNGKLFLGAALYDQKFSRKPQGSDAVEYHYKGAEFEINYQPNKNFYTTFSYGVIIGEVEATGFQAGRETITGTNDYLFVPGVFTGGTTNQIPGTNSQAAYANKSNVRAQGLPKHQFNALMSYTFDNGFGASINGTLHSEINNNWAGTIVIPWQFEIDTSLFYTYKNWNFRLAILNVTDEFNFAPPNGVYGNESILIEEGLRSELTVTYKF
jgi:catecholate siderophore receptor